MSDNNVSGVVINNTSDLRVILAETIGALRSGAMEPKTANAIAGMSTKIIQTARLDLDVMKFAASRPPQSPALQSTALTDGSSVTKLP